MHLGGECQWNLKGWHVIDVFDGIVRDRHVSDSVMLAASETSSLVVIAGVLTFFGFVRHNCP